MSEDPHASPPADEPTSSGIVHALSSVALFAVAASLFLHALFTYVAATTSFGSNSTVATTVSVEVELAEIVQDDFEPAAAPELSLAEPELEPIPEPEILDESLADVPVPESELASFSVSDVGELGSAGDAASQIGSATLSAASASFFGVEARGSRFVYIVDTSGSMASNRLDALKIALSESINALVDQARFAVIRYSSDAESLNPDGWWTGEARDKDAALRAVSRLSAGQSTEPVPAFRLAFELTPPPDAVYFMTDGRFSGELENEIVGSIRRLMRQSQVTPTIHAITFVDKDAENLLRRIARMTGGSYTHVPGLGP